jgi:hypothetical protein
VQAFADGFVSKRRRISLDGTPVFGVGPLLVSVEFVEVGRHSGADSVYSFETIVTPPQEFCGKSP